MSTHSTTASDPICSIRAAAENGERLRRWIRGNLDARVSQALLTQVDGLHSRDNDRAMGLPIGGMLAHLLIGSYAILIWKAVSHVRARRGGSLATAG